MNKKTSVSTSSWHCRVTRTRLHGETGYFRFLSVPVGCCSPQEVTTKSGQLDGSPQLANSGTHLYSLMRHSWPVAKTAPAPQRSPLLSPGHLQGQGSSLALEVPIQWAAALHVMLSLWPMEKTAFNYLS